MTRTVIIKAVSHQPTADICASTTIRNIVDKLNTTRSNFISDSIGKEILVKAETPIYDTGEAMVKIGLTDPITKMELGLITASVKIEAEKTITRSTGGLTISVSLEKVSYSKTTGSRDESIDRITVGVNPV